MIKFKQGSVTNPKTGKSKDIIVKTVTANKFKDIVVGGGMVLIGIIYLTTTAFKNGSQKFDDAEMQVFADLELLDD